MKHKAIVVGGSFNDTGGKSSKLIKEIAAELSNHYDVTLFNGGQYDDIQSIFDSLINYKIIFWMPNIPNDKEKIRDIKKLHPTSFLITSKRNYPYQYTINELLAKALENKSNLFIEFTKYDDKYFGHILDPLGNSWGFSSNFTHLTKNIVKRINETINLIRENSQPIPWNIECPDQPEFFKIVKDYAEIFHKLIDPIETSRFLGNSSFRCTKGFPSFKDNGTVFVSQRNIDKRYIEKENFVPIKYDCGLLYGGNKKPSVDSPIQIRLYDFFPKINFMIHAHVYIEGAPFTQEINPCGVIDEHYSILRTVKYDHEKFNFSINLKGHGCIVMAKDLEYFNSIKFIARPKPEKNYFINPNTGIVENI